MSPALNDTGEKLVSMKISEAHARLDRLDTEERQRWSIALIIMLLLVAGLVVLSFPGPAHAILNDFRMTFALRGVLALLLVYLLATIRRYRMISEMRRELASQLGVIAAMETLKLVVGDNPAAKEERRRMQRISCDLRLSVLPTKHGDAAKLYGRMRDICEHGIGAIVPGDLAVGDPVLLRVSLDGVRHLELKAIVRQRGGFRYGFEFVDLSSAEQETIERFRVGRSEVVSISAENAGVHS